LSSRASEAPRPGTLALGAVMAIALLIPAAPQSTIGASGPSPSPGIGVTEAVSASASSPSASSPPASSSPAIVEGGDPRSEGEGPGMVGDPLLVLLGVVLLGLATAAVTVVAARWVGRS